jgi:glycerophosphoryl diester phosphodiesterase
MNFLDLFKKRSLIGAHRGARSLAPENTLKALRLSLGKCDFIEIDVALSQDKVAVIMHDETLKRTTNVKNFEEFKKRSPYNVCDFTYEELQKLDYGEGEPLLTLDSALAFVQENSAYMNVELKDVSGSFEDDFFVSLVLAAIQKYKLESSILLSSFRHEYLRLVKQKMPNIPTAALVENEHPPKFIEYLKALKVEVYNFNKELVDEQTVQKLRDAGFFVGIYTVNTKKRKDELFAMGVNAIYTDKLYLEPGKL